MEWFRYEWNDLLQGRMRQREKERERAQSQVWFRRDDAFFHFRVDELSRVDAVGGRRGGGAGREGPKLTSLASLLPIFSFLSSPTSRPFCFSSTSINEICLPVAWSAPVAHRSGWFTAISEIIQESGAHMRIRSNACNKRRMTKKKQQSIRS